MVFPHHLGCKPYGQNEPHNTVGWKSVKLLISRLHIIVWHISRWPLTAASWNSVHLISNPTAHTGLNWDFGVHGDFWWKSGCLWFELIWVPLPNICQNYQVSSNLTSFWQSLCKELVRKPIKISWKRSANTSILRFLELRSSNYPYLDLNNWF